MQIDLRNRIAVVTGGSGQLGRAMVRTLASCGADVAIHYHSNVEQARLLCAEVQQMGVRAVAVAADITQLESVKAMQQQISAALGTPDIIVNNAVAQYRWTSILEQDPADYESQFRTCVLHNVHMIKAFVPGMMQRKWGRVIAINTELAMLNMPNQSAYVSGKRGMDGVLRVLAHEVGEYQITVNQVAPGWMASEGVPDGVNDQAYKKGVPLKRRGCDQDVANLVAFLASDLAGFISGAFIPVSGGTVMPAI